MIVFSNDCADSVKWEDEFERKIDMCWYGASKGYAKGLYCPKGGDKQVYWVLTVKYNFGKL